MKIICEWSGPHLWGRNDRNGLSLDDQGLWYVVDPFTKLKSPGYVKANLIDHDPNWASAFATIESGHRPSWKECSCGAKAVMGKNWDGHDSTCEAVVLSSPFQPKNNDGRDVCYNCAEPTKPAGGGQYMVCKNKDCNWYDK